MDRSEMRTRPTKRSEGGTKNVFGIPRMCKTQKSAPNESLWYCSQIYIFEPFKMGKKRGGGASNNFSNCPTLLVIMLERKLNERKQ